MGLRDSVRHTVSEPADILHGDFPDGTAKSTTAVITSALVRMMRLIRNFHNHHYARMMCLPGGLPVPAFTSPSLLRATFRVRAGRQN